MISRVNFPPFLRKKIALYVLISNQFVNYVISDNKKKRLGHETFCEILGNNESANHAIILCLPKIWSFIFLIWASSQWGWHHFWSSIHVLWTFVFERFSCQSSYILKRPLKFDKDLQTFFDATKGQIKSEWFYETTK